MKVKLPEVSAITVAVAAPVTETLAAPPAATGVIVPESEYVVDPVKFTFATLEEVMVTACDTGENTYAVCDGVTVYDPAGNAVKV